MATKKSTKPILRIGERVGRVGSEGVYEITRISPDGTEVDLCLAGANLQWFRVSVEKLTIPKK